MWFRGQGYHHPMPRRPRPVVDGPVYPALNRSKNRSAVCFSADSYRAFLARGQAHHCYPLRLYGHCLLSKHFHLLRRDEPAPQAYWRGAGAHAGVGAGIGGGAALGRKRPALRGGGSGGVRGGRPGAAPGAVAVAPVQESGRDLNGHHFPLFFYDHD